MDEVTRNYIYRQEFIGTIIIIFFIIYLLLKIYKKIVKKIPFVNITRKTDLHRDIKKHITNNHKKYELFACLLVPILLYISIWCIKDFLLDLPKIVLNKYEQLSCIALEDNREVAAGNEHVIRSNSVKCNCEGENIKIYYVPDTLKIKKGQSFKVNYLRNLQIGTIIDIE